MLGGGRASSGRSCDRRTSVQTNNKQPLRPSPSPVPPRPLSPYLPRFPSLAPPPPPILANTPHRCRFVDRLRARAVRSRSPATANGAVARQPRTLSLHPPAPAQAPSLPFQPPATSFPSQGHILFSRIWQCPERTAPISYHRLSLGCRTCTYAPSVHQRQMTTYYA